MAKNMYQKREERKAKNNNKEIDNKTNINWLILFYSTPLTNPYKIRKN